MYNRRSKTAGTKHIQLWKHLKKRVLFGFTLVETLVVVGIVGLLTGIIVTTINVEDVFDSSHDSVRKQDLNTLHKAFMQYYTEHHCVPPQSLWDSISCNGEVPDSLKPFLAKIPCDPETNQKYGYELLDRNCNQCNGGCAMCVGFRFLAQLKKKSDVAPGAGCNKESGCGKLASNGKPFTYGVAMQPASCVIPTPIPTSTINPTQIPTQVPSVAPTPTPSDYQVWIGNGNNTITRVNESGIQIASPISGNGIAAPYGISVVGNEVWVLNYNDSISRFTYDGVAKGIYYPPNRPNLPKSISVVGDQVWIPYYFSDQTRGIMRLHFDGSQAGSILKGTHLPNPFAISSRDQTVWVTNDTNNSIQRLNVDGTPIGNPITGNGLNYPEGIANVGNEVWVTQLLDDSVVRFSSDGTPIAGKITGNGLVGPFGILQVGNEVWVANSLNNARSVSRFTLSGSSAGTPFTGTAFPEPWSLAIVPKGTVPFATPTPTLTPNPTPTATPTRIPSPTPLPTPTTATSNGDVWITISSETTTPYSGYAIRMKQTGELIGSPIRDVIQYPHGLTRVGNEIWITTVYSQKIYRYALDGTYTGNFIAPAGASALQSIGIVGNQVWVTNGMGWQDSQIYRLNFDGTEAAPPIKVNSYYGLRGFEIIGNEVWVVDFQFGILRYTFDGQSAGPKIVNPDAKFASDFAIVGSQVWVSDSINYRIVRLNTDGTTAAAPISNVGLHTPKDIMIVGNEVWVTNLYKPYISRFNFDGTLIGTHTIGTSVIRPWGMTIAP